MAKLQPAVMTLNFSGDGYIDISQSASIVNRRFYRQGLNWAVSGFTVQFAPNASPIGNVRIETLPTTWVMSNAWQKAFSMWLKQQNDAIEKAGAESAVARFRDFKIFMDTVHVDAGFDANLLPTFGDGSGYFTAGEWEASQIVVPNILADASGSEVNPTEYFLHMVGINNNAGASRGIIDGYSNSRSFPQSPDPVTPAVDSASNWMQQMFDVGNDNEQVIDNAVDRNDNLPYPQVDYPGGDTQAPGLQLHSAHAVTGTTIGNRFTIPGCTVPCGLIKFSNDTGVNAQLQVHLMPGDHRGYLAESMQDM